MKTARTPTRRRANGCARRLVFVQLPLLDNDTARPSENFPLAAAYLEQGLHRTGEARHWEIVHPGDDWDSLGTGALVDRLERLAPDVLAATVYLWNVERTLDLCRRLKERRPSLKVILGGPETAHEHPLINVSPWVDAVVVGAGEAVFSDVLRWCRGDGDGNFVDVACRVSGGLRWGRKPRPRPALVDALPPIDALMPGGRKTPAYLETSRGCPLRCSYCRYHHLYRNVQYLTPRQVADRIVALAGRGVREIRFVDPTFNAHPRFDELLNAIAGVNRAGRLSFFAEVRADTLSPSNAERMARAGFAELEIGVQSIDRDVLKAVHRPRNLAALKRGIDALHAQGLKLTLDVMYGLPFQTATDVYASLDWCRAYRGAVVQCLQTLLLPGTELRDQAGVYGLEATPLPPYGVTATPWLGAEEMKNLEAMLYDDPALPSDVATARFVAYRLRGLFSVQVRVNAAQLHTGFHPPVRGARTALIIGGAPLFPHRHALADAVRACLATEPDGLWQFVLCPESEEPLDLLDEMADAIAASPPRLLDRFASASSFGLRASSRVLIRLQPGRHYDDSWCAAAEETLRRRFL